MEKQESKIQSELGKLQRKISRLEAWKAGQKRGDRDLAHERALLHSLMDNIPDWIFFKDIESRFIRVNESHARLLGLEDPEKAISKSDFDFFKRQDAQRFYEEEQEILRTKKPVIGRIDKTPTKQGKILWRSETKIPLVDSTGEVIGLVGISRDITDLKRAEEALMNSNKRLEKTVRKRTTELRKANEGMKVRIRQLDYLNQKANFFTQLIDRDSLLPAIFDSFAELFPDGEVHLADMQDDGFASVRSTPMLRSCGMISRCIKALEYLETSGEENLHFEKCWMNSASLEALFDSSLRKLPCYIIIPLITDQKLRGAVQVFAPREFAQVFSRESIVLNTLASHAAASLVNANSYQQLEERTRLKSELEIARGIQRRFTPDDPVIPGFQVRGFCRPANEIGGDYLDYFSNALGCWVLFIADVCGKGIPAALVMTSLRSAVRSQAKNETSSKNLMISVNDLMGSYLKSENSFITCMALIIDSDGTRMNFTRAGHPMLISYSNEKSPAPIRSRGVALGILDNERSGTMNEEVHLDLSSGDRFLAYTDGLDEAMNTSRDTYGLGRLLNLLNEKRSLGPSEAVDLILEDVRDFCGGQAQNDDLTLFALEKL